MDSPLIASLRRAVDAAPDDLPLRLHLAQQLLAAGDRDGAVAAAAAVLQRDPANGEALAVITSCTPTASTMPTATPGDAPPRNDAPPRSERDDVQDAQDANSEAVPDASSRGFDWSAAEAEVDGIVAPMFVSGGPEPQTSAFDTERPRITLADVGGLQEVKERLEASFLTPLRNPQLREMYAKSLRGGMLLYGPPGCGKTFLAKALAGELGAGFVSIGIADILDPFMGNSERNVRDAFRQARLNAPCVLFLDEIDALGHRRSSTRNDALRGTVNQLLNELDGVDGSNDGVFVLAATNQPWDVDPALRRPGRFDRTVLVLPPDRPAREAIFGHHLSGRPVEGIDLGKLAARSDGYSGADIAYVCEAAAERALLDGARTGTPRMIGMRDLDAALADHRASIGSWLESARNVVLFADHDGTWSDLRDYLKRAKRL